MSPCSLLMTALLLSGCSTPGEPVGPEFRVNTTTTLRQVAPSVARDDDGDFVIAWVGLQGDEADVYAQRYSADGTPQCGEFRVNTITSHNQGSPSVAVDSDGDFVIAWVGHQGDAGDIYAQRYSADGTTQGREFRVNTTTAHDQVSPSVAMDADGDFVIAWRSYSSSQVGVEEGIYAQRYRADGTPEGGAFRINTTTGNKQMRPSVGLDADGDFVITWASVSPGLAGDGGVIHAQRYRADGTPEGGEFRVDTGAEDEQQRPSVALDADGDFVIAWNRLGHVGDSSDIYARRYSADGTPEGGEFRVNVTTATYTGNLSTDLDADGDFVITWGSVLLFDGEPTDIFARRYSADGTSQGGEFRVNTTTAHNQSSPSVALNADGDFIITWDSFGQDGDSWGIYAQRFAGGKNFDF